jgi:hypothetical protein
VRYAGDTPRAKQRRELGRDVVGERREHAVDLALPGVA